MTGNEIRKSFLDFFGEKQHLVLPSAGLIPEDDPTLLIIGAGMAPFKPFFTGKATPPSVRIATCQKCVRTGDIENVGRTARHHTYFEMLGNFSFGDYFKKEVIPWAWEWLTEVLELPKDKLWVTIHTKDDEAFDIWTKDVGVPAERIVRLEDNFWDIGSGPCGPDSEIHIDLGPERGCGKPTCGPGCDCDRFLEIWNLVFTQYDHKADGTFAPLKNKNIDTGAGLERIASVLQGCPSNFETDLMFPIIEYAVSQCGKEYGKDKKTDISLKVIADHARSMTFMIGDGILPSNEGRGYVLRRILRRAVRHGRLLGIEKMFLAGVVDVVIKMFGDIYPNLKEKRDYIQKVIEMEETSFLRTLKQGTELLNAEIEKLIAEKKTVLDGASAFRLNDTFGFPWELTAEILAEHDMTMDKKGFDDALAKQRKMARDARDDKTGRPVVYNTRALSGLKVDESAKTGKIVQIFPATDAQPIEMADDGTDIAVVCDVTAFHAEGGGQLGDLGMIVCPTGKIEIDSTKKLPDGVVIMLGTVTEGVVKVGDNAEFKVNYNRKNDIARDHTATHLMQAALRKVLGTHVNQAGSYVGPDRLRFDFSHFSPVTAEELAEVERMVNEEILAAKDVEIEELPIEEAKKKGAMALFGEKYGKIVRVVTVPDFSMEFCGGTHVSNTAQIGMFKILSESSSGAGVRRIEAVTGHGATEYVKNMELALKNIAADLKCRVDDIPNRLNSLHDELKEIHKKVDELSGAMAKSQLGDVLAKVQEFNGVKVLVQKVHADNMDALRNLGDQLRDKVGGAVVLATEMEGKAVILAMAVKDAVAKGIHSGNIVKEIAKLCGGGGGGKPDMAQAGAKDLAKLDDALKNAWEIVKKQIKS